MRELPLRGQRARAGQRPVGPTRRPFLDPQGNRSAPSIDYLSFNTAFFFAADGTPAGGFFWDGRAAASLQAQAGHPPLAANETANASAAAVVVKLSRATYSEDFKRVFGADIFERADGASDRLTLALRACEREDPDFRPFTSKHDEFLRGNTSLSKQEMRGLALFNNPAKGNCLGCHPAAKNSAGSFPLFTDFRYDNRVPRNNALAQNADASYYDLGLCARVDLPGRADLCGAFKAPSLRNVDARHAYSHNGRFKTLKEALTFDVQRDTTPRSGYLLSADGSAKKFDDLRPSTTATSTPPRFHTTASPATRRRSAIPRSTT